MSKSIFRCLIATTAIALVVPLSVSADEADDQAQREGREIVVTGERLEQIPEAGKSDVPLIETPQAISIITAEDLKTRGVTRLAEALRGVAGVSRSSTYGYYDAYQIRGFDAAYGSVYLDGLVSLNVAGTNNELAGLEQVEVVKGPASMLFGSAPLGGIINLVSKRPKAEAFADATIATGSYGLIEASLDANGPLTGDGALLGRLNLLVRDSGDFVDFASKNRIYIAPSLTWNIGPATHLTLLGRYERNHDRPWSPVSAWGTVLPWAHGELPIDFTINNDDVDHAIHNQRYIHAGYVLDHSFSHALSFNQTLRYTDRRIFWNNWNFWAGFVDNEIVDGVQQGHIAGRYIYGPFYETDKDIAVDSRFTLKFATGPVRHNIMAGLDYRGSKSSYHEDGGNYDPAANPLDLLDPDFDAPLIHDPAAAYSGGGTARQTGLYLQDHLSFGDAATLTLGGRYDWASSDGQKDEKFSPRVGATVAIAAGAALYASWSRSFVPQPGYFTVAGEALPPETGRNVEAGIKVQSANARLSGMISIFELTRQNVATEDPANPFFYVTTGEQRSRGIEIEGTWHPVPGATLAVAYAYLDAKITKDNLLPVGARLQNVPRHGLNLFGEYVVPSGPLADLGINAAFQYNSSKVGANFPEDLDFDGDFDALSLFTLPSYAIFDAGVSYRYRDWTLRLNVNNLFDKRYYPDSCCVDRVTPGEPRSWRLTLGRHF
ncbi:TonB-dependent siderophore receptor [Sphingopyxis sp. NJF-3]